VYVIVYALSLQDYALVRYGLSLPKEQIDIPEKALFGWQSVDLQWQKVVLVLLDAKTPFHGAYNQDGNIVLWSC
jgi:hypothetical protein